MVRGLLEKDVGWYPEKDISAHLDILCKDAVLDVNGSDLGVRYQRCLLLVDLLSLKFIF